MFLMKLAVAEAALEDEGAELTVIEIALEDEGQSSRWQRRDPISERYRMARSRGDGKDDDESSNVA